MPSALETLMLLGPRPRPALGGPYHPNGERRRRAEDLERRERVKRLMEERYSDGDGEGPSPPKRRSVTFSAEALFRGEARPSASTAISVRRTETTATATSSSLTEWTVTSTKSKAAAAVKSSKVAASSMTSMREAKAAAVVASSTSTSSGLAQSTATSMLGDEATVATRPSALSTLADARASTKSTLDTTGPSAKFILTAARASTKCALNAPGPSAKSSHDAAKFTLAASKPSLASAGPSPMSTLAAAAAMRRAEAASMVGWPLQRRAEATSASPYAAIKRTTAVLGLTEASAKRRMISKAASTPSSLPPKDRLMKVMEELSEAMTTPTVYTTKPDMSKASKLPRIVVMSPEDGGSCPMCKSYPSSGRQARPANLQIVVPTVRDDLISEDESTPDWETPVTPIETIDFPRLLNRSPSSR